MMKKLLVLVSMFIWLLLPVQSFASRLFEPDFLVVNAQKEQLIKDLTEIAVLNGWDIGHKDPQNGLLQIKIYTSYSPACIKEFLRLPYIFGELSEIRWKVGIKVSKIDKDLIVTMNSTGGLGKSRFIMRLYKGLVAKGYNIYAGDNARQYYIKNFDHPQGLPEDKLDYFRTLFKKPWRGTVEDLAGTKFQTTLKFSKDQLFMLYKGVYFPVQNATIQGNAFSFSLYSTEENKLFDASGTLIDNKFNGKLYKAGNDPAGIISLQRR